MTIKNWRAPEIVQAVRQGAMAGVVDGIGIVERRAVELITQPPKTGRIYSRRGVKHQSSAPGEAPASDTSRLVNSRRIILNPKALKARLQFAAKHARHLEHGTKKMEPRPFARRALLETVAQVNTAVFNGIVVRLKQVAKK